jgi:hypothetical protein
VEKRLHVVEIAMEMTHMKRRPYVVCLVAILATVSVLVQGASAEQASSRKAASVVQSTPTVATPAGLKVDDVLKMSKAGLGDDVIVEMLIKNGQPFDLSPDQLIALKGAKVSDRVIQTMLNPGRKDTTAKTAAVAPATSSGSELPSEAGVYAKKGGEWVEILPEVVNWKTGGVLKSIASAGVVKGDVNGHVEGKNSRNSFGTPIEFLIVLPEAVAITEYQLLRLRQNEDSREFRTITGGVMHVKSGATRDLVPFEGRKSAAHVYSVVFPANLGAGEYGFLPPGAYGSTNAAGSTGKLYSFRVIE